ncbi:MAG: GntR family transcriptional regulator [Vulcanimicrobiaceae bacterium]
MTAGGRVRSVERLEARLRKLIDDGTYPPGCILSQVQLARMLGVSRTPLREAMRRLEAEGLIECEQNHRARVTLLDAESLDVLYTDRILLEAAGIKVTVPRLSEVDLNALLSTLAALRVATTQEDPGAQDRARRSFHRQLVGRAGKRLRAAISEQFERCETHRRRRVPLPGDALEAYTAIAGACIARDGDAASVLTERFEAELARRVLMTVNARYEPVATRIAVQMLDGSRPARVVAQRPAGC